MPWWAIDCSLANRLDRAKGRPGSSRRRGSELATVAGYQAAKKAAGPAAAATAYVDMAARKAEPQDPRGARRTTIRLGALLFLGVTETLRDSQWLSLGLTVENGVLRLRAAVDGKTTARSGIASFTWPQAAGEGALPNLRVPRRIAAGSLYRDLHAFYAAKDNLFPERTSGLIFFENMMGIFFTGRDLTEEVLSETQPEVRFVVAQQQYDPAIGTPQVQLPALAARLPPPPSRAGRGNDRRGLAKSDRAGELHPRTKGRAGVDPRSRVLRRHSFYRGPFLGGGAEGQDRPAHPLQYPAFDRADRRLPGAELDRTIDPRRARCAAERDGRSAAAGGRRFQR